MKERFSNLKTRKKVLLLVVRVLQEININMKIHKLKLQFFSLTRSLNRLYVVALYNYQ